MIHYSHVCLDTFGYQLPPRVITSEEIEDRLSPLYDRLHLPRGRLELMSGIRERRLWPEGTRPSEAAIHAGEKVLANGNIDAKDIECLIFSSVSRDMMEPATASFVHNSLGLSSSCLIFDISNACLGFLDGMVVLASMIELGQVQNGLVVSGETAEELLESTLQSLRDDKTFTRKSIKPAFASLTIGSGSMGLFMRRAEKGEKKPRLVCGAWKANTAHSDLCHGEKSGQNITLMATNSEELLTRGVETALLTWREFSANPGWQGDDIDHFFCHQVGSAHARLLFEQLELAPEKNFATLATLGNVGSVSAPVTMAMAIEQGVFQPGKKGALLGIGSGINCMMLGVEWSGQRKG
ncbi:MAG: 3-oxoacyl-ACP synthase III [Deltaproteobacteria bacterium]|nr:3-oxoacyl-ACP synthase III [Deltaproteobacteria bacterium]MBW2658406.1 3-oxoacyl-ACP synthase III [Deltaproteobacteria bacterium]